MSQTQASSADLSPSAAQARRRRTFAIISHPDAGKTTLTEHLLLLGGRHPCRRPGQGARRSAAGKVGLG